MVYSWSCASTGASDSDFIESWFGGIRWKRCDRDAKFGSVVDWHCCAGEGKGGFIYFSMEVAAGVSDMLLG